MGLAWARWEERRNCIPCQLGSAVQTACDPSLGIFDVGVATEAVQWLLTAPMPTLPASVVHMSRRQGGFPVSSGALTELQGWRERHCRCQMPWEPCVLPSLEEPWFGHPGTRGLPATDFSAALQTTLFLLLPKHFSSSGLSTGLAVLSSPSPWGAFQPPVGRDALQTLSSCNLKPRWA